MGSTCAVRLIAAVGVALYAGCSADGGIGRERAGQSAFAGAGGGAGAGGIPGGSAGGGAGGAGAAGGVFIPDTSTAFHRDDTGMAGLDPATLDKLKQGGACTSKLLYPYGGTVFPGGLPAPPLMWEGAAEAAYVQLSYANVTTVDYQFAVAASDPGELRIPQDAWNEIARRTQNTPLQIKLSVLSGGAVSTCETSWGVAPGNMVGAVYYNTYSAPGALHPDNGAVMRMTLGLKDAGIYIQWTGAVGFTPGVGPCISCHSVSANGSTLVASAHSYELMGKFFEVDSYQLQVAPQPPAGAKQPNANFAALYPDGTRLLGMGNPDCNAGSDTFPRTPNNMPLVEGPEVARVMDVATGEVMAASGLDPSFYMWTPQFSPDGKMVVFNHAKPDGSGGSDRRELAVMDYDYATNSFSNLRVIASRLGPDPSLPYAPMAAGAGPVPTGNNGCTTGPASGGGGGTTFPGLPPGIGGGASGPAVGALDPGTCTGPCYPFWPFFTPDGRGVVFQLNSEPDSAAAFPGRDTPAKGELWYADVQTGETVPLDNANRGLAPGDALSNYYPTVLPVMVGGYYWVFWSTPREFGHRAKSGGAGFALPTGIPGGSDAKAQAFKKRIWVAAIRPRGMQDEHNGPLTDPSKPGFYLEDQTESGNVRAFATLNPCVAVGTTCTSGLDCCTGFCAIEPGAASGTCTDVVPMCSKTNDRCDSNEDCCPPDAPDQPQNTCIAGFCSFILVE